MPPAVRNLAEAAQTMPLPWKPAVAGAVDGYHVKVVVIGETFDWHHHAGEDEAFLLLEGRMAIDFEDGAVELGPNDLVVVPKGVEHRPRALSERPVAVLFERAETLNTGNVITEKTVTQPAMLV